MNINPSEGGGGSMRWDIGGWGEWQRRDKAAFIVCVRVYILGTMENLRIVLAKQVICNNFHFLRSLSYFVENG